VEKRAANAALLSITKAGKYQRESSSGALCSSKMVVVDGIEGVFFDLGQAE